MESKYSEKELQKMLRKKQKESECIVSEGGTFSKDILNKLFRDFRIFTILVLLIFWQTGSEPVVLIGGVVGFLSVEVWQLARIKITESGVDDGED